MVTKSSSFVPLLDIAGKISVITPNDDLPELHAELSAALSNYIGQRHERSNSEQLLYLTLVELDAAWRDHRQDLENRYWSVKEEYKIFLSTVPRYKPKNKPKIEFDFPAVTPATWAKETSEEFKSRPELSEIPTTGLQELVAKGMMQPDAADLFFACRAIVDQFRLTGEINPRSGEDNFYSSSETLTWATTLSKIDNQILQIANNFKREYKQAKVFGSPKKPVIDNLSAALKTFVESFVPKYDPLGKLFYVWSVEDSYFGQYFVDGRPATDVDSASSIEFLKEKLSIGARAPRVVRGGSFSFSTSISEYATVDATVVSKEAPKPYLYILMRNDLSSLNAGKAVAQGSHAANQMVVEAMKGGPSVAEMVSIWSKEANGFGTCIVLGATEKQMRAAISSAKAAGLHAGITNDPTYPVKDGESFYTVSLDTCGYIFDYQVLVKPHVVDLDLMP